MNELFKKIENAKIISPQKLSFLEEMYNGCQHTSKDKDKMMTFMMNVATKSKEQNIRFSKEEMQLIVNILREKATPAENSMMDAVIKKGLNN